MRIIGPSPTGSTAPRRGCRWAASCRFGSPENIRTWLEAHQYSYVLAVACTEAVEIQTARYSEARTPADRERELAVLENAAAFVRDQGLHLHMGHGLTYTNVQPICRIAGLEELNIGHSIVSRAVLVGVERAVREMKDAIRRSA